MTAFEAKVEQKLAELVGVHKAFMDGVKSDMAKIQNQVDALDVRVQQKDIHMPASGYGFPGYTTPGEIFIKRTDDIELLKKTNRMRFGLDRLHPAFETKTLIDSAALGFSTPGILNAERILDGIVPLARRRLTVRDLLRTKPVTAGQVDWIQQLAFTNAASPQTEGSDKGESATTFQIASEVVRTLAHWIPVTKQALDDLPELRRIIDEVLIYGLKLIEEYELLWGDGTGQHLHGIGHQATAYAGTYAAANDTKLDVLRHAIAELEVAEEEATGIILNPKDVHDIDVLKTEDSGTANTGAYLIGNPLGGVLRVRTYWGRPVVSTTAITAGTFLVGNFANGVIGDRQGATIDVSDSHDDYFIRNKLALRVEERLSVVSLDSGRSMRYGSF